MRISREPPPLCVMIHQKQLQNVEHLNYLGSIITNYSKCTHTLKSRTAMANAAFNWKKNVFTSKLYLNMRKKVVKCYIWIVALYGAET